MIIRDFLSIISHRRIATQSEKEFEKESVCGTFMRYWPTHSINIVNSKPCLNNVDAYFPYGVLSQLVNRSLLNCFRSYVESCVSKHEQNKNQLTIQTSIFSMQNGNHLLCVRIEVCCFDTVHLMALITSLFLILVEISGHIVSQIHPCGYFTELNTLSVNISPACFEILFLSNHSPHLIRWHRRNRRCKEFYVFNVFVAFFSFNDHFNVVLEIKSKQMQTKVYIFKEEDLKHTSWMQRMRTTKKNNRSRTKRFSLNQWPLFWEHSIFSYIQIAKYELHWAELWQKSK